MARDDRDDAPSWLIDVVVAVLGSERVRQVLVDTLLPFLHVDHERPELLTSDELCAQLRISRSKLDTLVLCGLPSMRVGSTKRFRLGEVVDWLRAQGEGKAA